MHSERPTNVYPQFASGIPHRTARRRYAGRMSTPSHDPQPSERDPNRLSGTEPLNPAEPGPTQNSSAGLSPEPQKPGSEYGQQSGSPYGYQAAQPSGYAYPSSAAMPEAQRPPMPKEVNWAFWMIIAAAVLNLISAFVASNAVAANDIAGIGTGFTIITALFTTAIYVLLAVFIRKGHNWARITAAVLAAISVILMVMGWFLLAALQNSPELQGQAGGQAGAGAFETTLSIVVTLLGVVAVVLCFLKQSNPYFKPQQPTH